SACVRWARPAGGGALLTSAVIAPVAALDPRAFWAYIVAYNMGLPGGDTYPLGGTPGFGFANFLVVGRAVSSLRDPFPFGIFYLLLVPLCLLLLRLVVREGTLPAALAAGSAALVASLYFGRVVHANYLVLVAAAAAAIVAPAAFVAWSGMRTGVARGQDEWLARVVAPAPAREAWSPSFRRDPPGPLIAGTEPAPVAPHVWVRDPRPLTLAAAGLATFLLARLMPPGARRLVLAPSMLSPAMVFAVVFGSPQPLLLVGLCAGALVEARARLRGAVLGGVLAWVVTLVLAGGPGWPSIGPGLGLSNVLLYRGIGDGSLVLGL